MGTRSSITSARRALSAAAAPPESVEICILAGGLSSRMGRDKSRLRLGGKSLLSLVREAAKRMPFPARVIRRDLVPRCGPLGGAYTALKTTRCGAVLFLACDMPFIETEWMSRVVNANSARRLAVFTGSSQGPGFPFLLRRDALPRVEEQIAAGPFSLHELAAKCRAKILHPPNENRALFNINTPADAKKARNAILSKSPTCKHS